MVDVGNKEPVRIPETLTKGRRHQEFRATVDQNDTVTLDVGTIVSSGVYKLSDGAAVGHTPVAAVITIDDALTDEDVVGWAIGAIPA